MQRTLSYRLLEAKSSTQGNVTIFKEIRPKLDKPSSRAVLQEWPIKGDHKHSSSARSSVLKCATEPPLTTQHCCGGENSPQCLEAMVLLYGRSQAHRLPSCDYVAFSKLSIALLPRRYRRRTTVFHRRRRSLGSPVAASPGASPYRGSRDAKRRLIKAPRAESERDEAAEEFREPD